MYINSDRMFYVPNRGHGDERPPKPVFEPSAKAQRELFLVHSTFLESKP